MFRQIYILSCFFIVKTKESKIYKMQDTVSCILFFSLSTKIFAILNILQNNLKIN